MITVLQTFQVEVLKITLKIIEKPFFRNGFDAFKNRCRKTDSYSVNLYSLLCKFEIAFRPFFYCFTLIEDLKVIEITTLTLFSLSGSGFCGLLFVASLV